MNLRDYERASIVQFVLDQASEHLSGKVLDYGCGTQPYREIVEAAGGTYRGYDRKHLPGSVVSADVGNEPWDDDYDTILCTQVLQYAVWPQDLIRAFHNRCEHVVITYPTCWPEVEAADRWRFTKAGMEALLTSAGFTIVTHVRRGVLYDPRFPSGREKRITATGEELAVGYGVVARA